MEKESFDESVFETVHEEVGENNEIPEETLEEWVKASHDYDEQSKLVVGMHIGPCHDAAGDCCQKCGAGHTVAAKMVDGSVAMIDCTNPDCNNFWL